ncbi:MAG TPA: hypothetical protein VNK91_00370 [Burkholderiaceae bacterium]|nr:hypothetical protein [Burkholderiaceae bacterium]
MRALCFLFALSSLGAVSGVSAQSAALRGGTTGLGAELGYGFNSYLGLRGNLGAGSYNYDTTEDGIQYRATLKAGAGLLTFDLHPFAGIFRLSAGLGLNRTRVDFRAVPTEGTLTLGERVYNASDVGAVDGWVRFPRTVPYLGLGWGAATRPERGFYFTSDFGVFLGRASGSLTGTCAPSLDAGACAQLQRDLQVEAQAFQREAEKIKYYPVITGGFGYRF